MSTSTTTAAAHPATYRNGQLMPLFIRNALADREHLGGRSDLEKRRRHLLAHYVIRATLYVPFGTGSVGSNSGVSAFRTPLDGRLMVACHETIATEVAALTEALALRPLEPVCWLGHSNAGTPIVIAPPTQAQTTMLAREGGGSVSLLGPMYGGCLLRWGRNAARPWHLKGAPEDLLECTLRLHDRWETPQQYAAMSD